MPLLVGIGTRKRDTTVSTRLLISTAALLMGSVACSRLDPQPHVNQAADLTAQQIGDRPDWVAPWDTEPPVWDAQSILTRDQAVVMALRNNRELRADLAVIGQADADLVQAGLLQNPVLNFMMMFPSGGGRSMLWGNGLPMQPIQDLWLIPVRKQVARARLQQAMLRVADRAIEVSAAVKKVYARLQYGQRAIELIRDNMRIVEQSTEIIRVRQAAGQATQVDVNLWRIRYLRLESNLIEAQAEYEAAQRELLMLMGLAAAPEVWQVEPLLETTDPLEPPAEEDRLMAIAAEQRLDLQAALWQAQAAEENIRLTKREALWFPGLAVGLGFQRMAAPRSNNPSLAGRAGNAAFAGAWNQALGMPPSGPMPPTLFQPKMRDVDTMVGPMFMMELPIFDQGQGRIGRALYEYRQRVMEYESRLQQVIRAVREALVMYRQAYRQVHFYRDSIMAEVERNLELAQQSYVAGRQDLTIFLDVQEDLIRTRLEILGYYRDYLLQKAELERQVGGQLILATATQPASTQPAVATQPAALD